MLPSGASDSMLFGFLKRLRAVVVLILKLCILDWWPSGPAPCHLAVVAHLKVTPFPLITLNVETLVLHDTDLKGLQVPYTRNWQNEHFPVLGPPPVRALPCLTLLHPNVHCCNTTRYRGGRSPPPHCTY